MARQWGDLWTEMTANSVARLQKVVMVLLIKMTMMLIMITIIMRMFIMIIMLMISMLIRSTAVWMISTCLLAVSPRDRVTVPWSVRPSGASSVGSSGCSREETRKVKMQIWL